MTETCEALCSGQNLEHDSWNECRLREVELSLVRDRRVFYKLTERVRAAEVKINFIGGVVLVIMVLGHILPILARTFVGTMWPLW